MPFLQPTQRLLARSVETRDFKENSQETIDLNLGYDLKSVIVKLTGTITIGTAPTTYHDFAVPRLIDRIDVYSDGKDKYLEVPGLMAAIANFERKLARQLTDITTGTGAKTVECYYRLDLENADGPRPKDSALHTVKPFMTKLQIKIATGEFKDMCKTLGPFAVSSSALKMEILTEETIELDDKAYYENRLIKQRSVIEETINATSSSKRIKLPIGEMMTRGVILQAFDETKTLTNSMINFVSLKSGVDVAYLKSFKDVQELNRHSYGLQGTQLPDGTIFIDLCPSGNITHLWDTRGRSELDLVLDVTKPAGGDGTIQLTPVQFYEQDNTELQRRLGFGV